MKVTTKDIELANRFPTTPSTHGFGMTMGEARVSPVQLDRLLKLNLIHVATDRMVGDKTIPTPGVGDRRNCTTFIRSKP